MGDRYSAFNKSILNETRRICVDPQNIPSEAREKLEARGLVPKVSKRVLGKVYNKMQEIMGSDKKSWEREQNISNDAPGVRG